MWSKFNPIAIDDYSYSATGNAAGNVMSNDIAGLDYEARLYSFGGVTLDRRHPLNVVDIKGQYGTFHVSGTGAWTYELDDQYKNTDLTHNPLTEKIQYKTTANEAHTDTGYLTLDVGQMTHKPQPHEILTTFEKSYPSNYLDFTIIHDGGNLYVGQEGTNHFWEADPYGEGFYSHDGSSFVLEDMIVATGAQSDASGTVTFYGWDIHGHQTGHVTVNLWADKISERQHVDLSALGHINSMSYVLNHQSANWVDEGGLPTLLFDNILVETG